VSYLQAWEDHVELALFSSVQLASSRRRILDTQSVMKPDTNRFPFTENFFEWIFMTETQSSRSSINEDL